MAKSGKVRSVPMIAEVAQALARLSERDAWTGDDDLAFGDLLGGSVNRSDRGRDVAAETSRAA